MPTVVPDAPSAGLGRARYSARDIAVALDRPEPTPEQCAVIEAPSTSMLVVAGAGSGKTETMAARVVWLVANGHVAPDEVLGLTFTRKAAAELADRVGTRLRRLAQAGLGSGAGSEAGGEVPTTATYHAYAGGLVADHGLRLGVEPHARLLTDAGCWQLAHEVVTAYDGPMDAVDYAESTVTAAVIALCAELAEHLRGPAELEQELADLDAHLTGLPRGATRAKGYPPEVRALLRSVTARRALVPLLEAYQRTKRERDVLDFSDQVVYAAALAARVESVGALERDRYRVVLLDEFQDTSEAQLQLLRDLFARGGQPHRSCVTAVGDPNQAIYGWRGASAGTLTRFAHEFATADQPVILRPLSTSWRNAEDVLAVANTLAAPLREASPVPVERLVPAPGADRGSVTAARLETVEDESAYIADWIGRHWQRDRSAAVLCRRRAQFPAVVAALRDRGLPVEIVGLGGLLSTPEVADLVALLTVVHDPGRGDALIRLLTGPALRLGAADLDGLATWSRVLVDRRAVRRGGTEQARTEQARSERPELSDIPSIVEALDELPPPDWTGPDGQRIAALARERLYWLRGVIRHLRALTGHPLADLVTEAERVLGLDIEVLADPQTPFDQARTHLDAFTDVAVSFTGTADGPVLGAFLAWLEAAEAHERGLDRPVTSVRSGAVQVMTVHAAKGLEWDTVAVPGLVESVFPSHSAHRPAWNGRGWTVSEPNDRGWCSGLEAVPHSLRGDADVLPSLRWRDAEDLADLERRLVEHAAEGGRHVLAEERRLAYVAVTRARRDLLLTAPAWSSTGSLRVPSRFLTEVMAGASPSAAVTRLGPWTADPEPDPSGRAIPPDRPDQPPVIWPVPDDPHRRSAYERAARRVDAARSGSTGSTGSTGCRRSARSIDGLRNVLGDEITALLVERAVVDGDSRITITADSDPRVRGDVAPGDLMTAGGDGDQARDQAREYIRGHVTSTDLVAFSDDPERYARDRRRPMPHPGVATERRGTDFHAWIEQHYAMAAILDVDDLPGSADAAAEDPALVAMKDAFLGSEWSARVPEAIEMPVETVIGGVPVRARIDALFRDPDGRLVVVDWKTGAPPTGRQASSAAVQLGVYRLAVARLHGQDPQQVRAAFFYASTGETIYPDVPDEDRLTALVAQPMPRLSPSGRGESGEAGA